MAATEGDDVLDRLMEQAPLEEGKARTPGENEDRMQALQRLKGAFSGAISLPAEQDDAQLVKASQQGDQQAFALLVQRHQRRIFLLSMSMLHDEEEASEITQETFVAAWQKLPSFRHEARFPLWLTRLASQYCVRRLDRRRREHALQTSLRVQERLEGVNHEKQAVQTGARDDLQTCVREQLEHLSSTSRLVLILRHLHHMTYEEMADILTLPIGTIKTHLFGARKLLKERLLAQHLLTRGTASRSSFTEKEDIMHTAGQVYTPTREQNSHALAHEAAAFSQQRHVWLGEQHGWLEQQYNASKQWHELRKPLSE